MPFDNFISPARSRNNAASLALDETFAFQFLDRHGYARSDSSGR